MDLSNRNIVFDIETDNLFQTASRVWCVAAMDMETKEQWLWGPAHVMGAWHDLQSASVLIGHNIIAFDLPAMWTILGPWDDCPNLIDTLITSRFLWPERPGGHSLTAWGERLGYPKAEHDDWSAYSLDMANYCQRDVELNGKVLDALEEEHGATIPGFKVYNGESIKRAVRRA